MTTNVLVVFYSTYGHVHRMALAVAEGAESVPDTTVRLRRIAELEEARWLATLGASMAGGLSISFKATMTP